MKDCEISLFFLSEPSIAPKSVTAHNCDSGGLVVNWRHLPEKYFRGQPLGFSIFYYPTDAESDFDNMSVNYSTNAITLTNLKVYTIYLINVSAVSSGGIGPANTANARTGAVGRKCNNIPSEIEKLKFSLKKH